MKIVSKFDLTAQDLNSYPKKAEKMHWKRHLLQKRNLCKRLDGDFGKLTFSTKFDDINSSEVDFKPSVKTMEVNPKTGGRKVRRRKFTCMIFTRIEEFSTSRQATRSVGGARSLHEIFQKTTSASSIVNSNSSKTSGIFGKTELMTPRRQGENDSNRFFGHTNGKKQKNG